MFVWLYTITAYICIHQLLADNKTINCVCYNGFCLNNTCMCNDGWTGKFCESCFGRIKLSNQRSFISDGIGKYKFKSNCTWIITTKLNSNEAYASYDLSSLMQNFTLKLTPYKPLYLRLISFSAECDWDYIYIYDGDSIYAPLIASISGTFSNYEIENFPDLVAKTGQAYIYFYSDDSFSYSGFNISYWNDGCYDNLCSGNGICTDGKCHCYANWTGKDCEINCNQSNDPCTLAISSRVNLITIDEQGPARASHSLISNGKDLLFLFGGYSHSAISLSDQYIFIYRYNLTSRIWYALKSKFESNQDEIKADDKFFEKPLIGHTAVYLQPSVYVFGGHDLSGTFSNALRIFDTSTSVWRHVTDQHVIDEPSHWSATRRFYEAQRGGSEFSGSSRIGDQLAVTGHTANLVRNLVLFNLKMESGEVVEKVDVMIVLFGYNPHYGYVPHVQEYYPEIGKWIVGPVTSGAAVIGRAGHVSVYDDKLNTIYVTGGILSRYSEPTHSSTSTLAYYPLQRRWEILEPSPYKLTFHSAYLYGDYILIYGGQAAEDTESAEMICCFSSRILLYDTKSNEWDKLPDLREPGAPSRYGQASAGHDKKQWYIHGGFNGLVEESLFHWDVALYLDRCEALLQTFITKNSDESGLRGNGTEAVDDEMHWQMFRSIKDLFKRYVLAQIYGGGGGDKGEIIHALAPNESSLISRSQTRALVKTCLVATISKSLSRQQFNSTETLMMNGARGNEGASLNRVVRQAQHDKDEKGNQSMESNMRPLNVEHMSADQFMAYYHKILKMAASALPTPTSLKPLFVLKNVSRNTYRKGPYYIDKNEDGHREYPIFIPIDNVKSPAPPPLSPEDKIKNVERTNINNAVVALKEDPCKFIEDCSSCLSTRWSCRWCFSGCFALSSLSDQACFKEPKPESFTPSSFFHHETGSINLVDMVGDEGQMAVRETPTLGNTYILDPGQTVKSLAFMQRALYNRTIYTKADRCPIWFNNVCSAYTTCTACHMNPNCAWGLHRLNKCVMMLYVKGDEMTLYKANSQELDKEISSNRSIFRTLSLNIEIANRAIKYKQPQNKRNPRGCESPCALYNNCANCTEARCIWCTTFGTCIDPRAYTITYPYGLCTNWASFSLRCPPASATTLPRSKLKDSKRVSPQNKPSVVTTSLSKTEINYDADGGNVEGGDDVAMELPRFASLALDLCASHASCWECQKDPACGWCDAGTETGKGTCLPGGLSGSIFNADSPAFLRVNSKIIQDGRRMNYAKPPSNHDEKSLEDGYGGLYPELTCPKSRWFFLTCPLCQCNGHAACLPGSSTCLKCGNHTTGSDCGICESGFKGDARNGGSCSECSCNSHATTCHRLTGACHCDTKGIIGHNCDACDKVSHYYGMPTKGATCYYTLNTDYMFTFNLTKPDDQYYTKINLMNRMEKPDSGVEFKISCSGMPKMNISITKDSQTEVVQIIGNQYCSNQFIMLFDHKYFPSDKGNTTFFISLYDFEVPIWIMVSFSVSPKLDILQFFITFLSCFLFLLFVAAVSWKIKQKYDIHRRRQRLFYEMEQMATRPFSSFFLYLESKPLAFYMKKRKRNRPTPIALEPLKDERSAVLSVIVRLPTAKDKDGNPITPYGASGLALGSALVSMATINLGPEGGIEGTRKDLANPLIEQRNAARRKFFLGGGPPRPTAAGQRQNQGPGRPTGIREQQGRARSVWNFLHYSLHRPFVRWVGRFRALIPSAPLFNTGRNINVNDSTFPLSGTSTSSTSNAITSREQRL